VGSSLAGQALPPQEGPGGCQQAQRGCVLCNKRWITTKIILGSGLFPLAVRSVPLSFLIPVKYHTVSAVPRHRFQVSVTSKKVILIDVPFFPYSGQETGQCLWLSPLSSAGCRHTVQLHARRQACLQEQVPRVSDPPWIVEPANRLPV